MPNECFLSKSLLLTNINKIILIIMYSDKTINTDRGSDDNLIENNDSMEDLDTNAPPEFICPITLSIMKDPVLLPDGQTYEREAIKKALSVNPISPVTREPMDFNQARTNYALKSLIDNYIKTQRSKPKNEQPTKNPTTDSQSPPVNSQIRYPPPPDPDYDVTRNDSSNIDRINNYVSQLMSMGYDEKASRAALYEADNDFQRAVNILARKKGTKAPKRDSYTSDRQENGNERTKNFSYRQNHANDDSNRNYRERVRNNNGNSTGRTSRQSYHLISVLIIIILFAVLIGVDPSY